MDLFDRASRDWAFLRNIVRILRRATPIAKRPNHTLGDLADELAARYGDRVALESEGGSLTYRDWNRRADQVARWVRSQGLGKGDVVALLMPNRIEYLSIWVGIAKAGAATALLNTNLTGEALAHSIRIVAARVVIVDPSLLPAFETARPLLSGVPWADPRNSAAPSQQDEQDCVGQPTQSCLDGAPAVWAYGAAEDLPRLDLALDALPDGPLTAEEKPRLTIDDRCLYVYTSGTTGLPKAANLNHYRVQLAMWAFSAVTNAKASDRMYDCLPMYHTNGGVLAPGAVMVMGGTCVIRERFSARDFWPDVARSRCTMFVYIGELCRYLLNAPPTPADRDHRVRLCFGNGLRPDVWVPFRDRFGLRHIREFYASTEGNCSMFNFDSRPEAVGRVPDWIASRFPMKVIRFDVEAEEEVRGTDGRCIVCAPDEVGELVGEILSDPKKPGNRFDGYSDREATARKVLRDVMAPGDRWFRTGDLMRRDAQGYFYFVDRIGDTFRWKGENVATLQVAEVLTGYPGIAEANVYGVAVPGTEGRAGMACIVPDRDEPFDLAGLRAFMAARLPAYAVPVFLRISEGLDVTGTFKQRKLALVAEGYDPDRVDGAVYVAPAGGADYRRLDGPLFKEIGAGALRL